MIRSTARKTTKKVFFLKPLQPFETSKHGYSFGKNVNGSDENQEYTSPQIHFHTIDGEHRTPLSEIHEEAHSLQPLQRSPQFQGNLGEPKMENDYGMVKITKITPKELKARGFKSRKQYIEHICSASIAATKLTRFATLKSKTMHHA